MFTRETKTYITCTLLAGIKILWIQLTVKDSEIIYEYTCINKLVDFPLYEFKRLWFATIWANHNFQQQF